MKKHICKIRLLTRLVTLAALLCVALFPVKAHAAAVAVAAIPVSVTVEGEEGTLAADIPTETYTFVLEAVTQGAPLPAETTVTITGAGSASFSIDYEKLGVYHYTVTQDSSALTGDNSICDDRGNYDSTVYYVTVSVISADDGSVGTVMAVHEGSAEGAKCVDLTFSNTYDPAPGTSTGEDPDDPDPEEPDSDDPDPDDPDPDDSDPDEPDSDDPDSDEPPAGDEPPDESGQAASPQTGDSANIVPYLIVMAAAAAALIALLIYRNRRK